MSRGKELIKNTGILMVARISTQIVSFLLLPLYTTLLTTENYGEIDIYSSVSMILIPLLTLQLEMGLFRYYITSKREDEKKEIVSSAFFVVLAVLLVASVLYFTVAISVLFSHLLLVYLYYLSQALLAVLFQVCRAKGDNVGYGISSFISSTCAVALNVFFIVCLQWKVEGVLAASAIAQFCTCFFIIYRTKIYSSIRFVYFNINVAKELLSYSVPLIFNQVASWAINYSDRVIIIVFWGVSINGIYSIANKFSAITSTFFGVYNIAWTENVVRSLEDKDNTNYLSKVFELTFTIYLALIIGIINCVPFVFNVMVNSSFAEAYCHIPILLVGMFFSGMAATLGSIFIAYKKTKEVSITTVLAGVTNVIVHFCLLKSCHLYAASISTLVSFAALFVYRCISIRKIQRLHFNWKSILIQLIILCFSWFVYSQRNIVCITCGLICNLCYMLFVGLKHKNLLIQMFKKK